MKVKIYHNSRCSKSRKALEFLEEKGCDIEVISYLESGLEESEIVELSKLLGTEVKEFMHKKESEFSEMNLKDASEADCIKALVECPKLLERPIVVRDSKAEIGRPTENLERLFS